ncbi:MAG: TolC family protein, partial [Vicinamibacterales bacterium]
FQVKAQVADVRAAQARQAAFVEMMGTGRDSLRLTRARVEEGDAAALEGQLLGVEVARIEAQLATSRGALMAALLDLRRVVGFVGSEPLAVEDSPGRSAPEAVALEALKVQALATRPDLRAARIAEEQAAAELALVRAEGIPDLTASVTLARETNAFEDLFATTASGRVTPIVDRDKRVMVGLSIPLFLPGRNRGAVDAALARATGARLHREYMEVAVPQEVEAAYARWMAANQAVELFRSNVLEQHQQNLNVMREAYTLGHLRLIDVLNEQRRVLDTRLAYVDAETELAQAAADLERAVGTELP